MDEEQYRGRRWRRSGGSGVGAGGGLGERPVDADGDGGRGRGGEGWDVEVLDTGDREVRPAKSTDLLGGGGGEQGGERGDYENKDVRTGR